MPEDLGARLVRAGLASREQLAEALALGPTQGGNLAARLLERGVSEDDLVGFFLTDGFGPLLDARDLQQARLPALERVRGEMAHALLALPIRESAAGLVVAMADPSDVHAVQELRYAIGGSVLPTVARVSDLRSALRRFYPNVPVEERPSDLPMELVRRRQDVTNVASLNESTGEPELVLPLTRPKGFSKKQNEPRQPQPTGIEDEPSAVAPLVTRKTFTAPKSEPPAVRSEPPRKSDAGPRSEPPPRTARRAPRSEPPPSDAPAPRRSNTQPIIAARATSGAPEPASSLPPPTSSKPPARSIIPDSEATWGDLSEPAREPANKVVTRPPPRPAPRPTQEPPPGDIGSHLAAMRAASDRDEIVRHACEAALSVSRSAVLLALRKGVLRGWDARGSGVSADAIRNLWIPATAPSMFKRVLERGEPHRGPYGTSAADNLYRAATGSRGGHVVIQPILVGEKAVAVLCADDVSHGEAGHERLDVIAHAVGTSFKRLIVTTKR